MNNPRPAPGQVWRIEEPDGARHYVVVRSVNEIGHVFMVHLANTRKPAHGSVESMMQGGRSPAHRTWRFEREGELVAPAPPPPVERERVVKTKLHLPRGMQRREIIAALRRHSPEMAARLLGIGVEVARTVAREEKIAS